MSPTIPLIISFILLHALTFGQDLRNCSLMSISEDSGLPSSETYDVVQDQEGYIWIATDNGLSKFNGQEHRVFDSRHGIKGKAVLHLFLQPDTSIVGISSENIFFRVKHNRVSEVIPADSLIPHLISGELPFSFFEDQKGFFHVGTRMQYLKFDTNGHLLSKEGLLKDNREIHFWRTNENQVFCYQKKRWYPKGRIIDEPILVYNGSKLIHQTTCPIDDIYKSTYLSCNDSLVIIPLLKSFLILNGKITEYPVEESILTTYLIDDQLFIGTKFNGVHCYRIVEGKPIFQYKLLTNFSVSSCLRDSDGNYWFTTLESGVKYFNVLQAKKLFEANNNQNIMSFLVHQYGLDIGFEDGLLISSLQPNTHLEQPIYSIAAIRNSIYYLCGLVFIKKDTANKPPTPIPFKGKYIRARTAFHSKNGRIVLLAGQSIRFYDPSNSTAEDILSMNIDKRMKGFKLDGRGFQHATLKENLLFVSTPDELIIFDYVDKRLMKTIKFPNIIGFFEYENHIWAISSGNRMIRVHENLSSLTLDLHPIDGANGIFAFGFDNGILHIATNKGLYSWELEAKSGNTKLLNYEVVSGIHSIQCTSDSIFFASKKSIYKKALKDLKILYPRILVNHIESQGRKLNANVPLMLAYNSGGIQIPVETIAFNAKEVRYRYFIHNFSKEYQYTTDPNIVINSLPPGDYTIEISASVNGITFCVPEIIVLTIDAPFWQKIPFIIAVAIGLIALVILIARMRIRRIRKKHALNETISQLKSQALSSQLNPHLIFNVMNSIQGLVSEGEIETANIFIARFSRFMRSCLHFSQVYSIPLKKEIELTLQYIDIEKIRFEDQIDFQVVVDQSANLQLQVPPLLIQPIIENAIKHGLMPSDQPEQTLKLRISSKANETTIEVEDNGVGFLEDTIYNTGMRVTTERIKLLNNRNHLIIKHAANPTVVELKLFYED